MKLGPIALKLRMAETRFGDYIFGSAELALALEYTLKKESAFVVQLAETASANKMDGSINQKINESFAVIVALDNGTSDKSKLGMKAYDTLHDVRAEIFRAILGWQMSDAEGLVSYNGGRIAGINRAYLWYQFEFTVETRIDDDDGIDTGADELDMFDDIYAQFILSPSAKLDTALTGPYVLPIADVDMANVIDFTDTSDIDGPFGKGFGIVFDVYKP